MMELEYCSCAAKKSRQIFLPLPPPCVVSWRKDRFHQQTQFVKVTSNGTVCTHPLAPLTHSLTHSLTRSLTHSLTQILPLCFSPHLRSGSRS